MQFNLLRLTVERSFRLALLATVGLASSQAASIQTVPPGVQAGQTYRLAFVTSTTTDATSTDIGVYNMFVQNLADSVADLAGLNATWTAIASTGTVNAVDNISWLSATDMIYGLDGTLVSDPSHLLFYDSNDAFFDAAIPTYEDGSAVTASQIVWTGTSRVGTNTQNGCCTAPMGSSTPFTGVTGTSNVTGAFAQNFDTVTATHLMYAISSEITAPAPEPGTTALAAFGLVALILTTRRQQAKQR